MRTQFRQRLTADPHWLPQLRCYCCQYRMMSSLASPPLVTMSPMSPMSPMSGRTCDVAPARAGEGLGTHRGREPGPGQGGPVLYWPPLPATRSQEIIIAITQDLNQAVVLTSLVKMSLDMGQVGPRPLHISFLSYSGTRLWRLNGDHWSLTRNLDGGSNFIHLHFMGTPWRASRQAQLWVPRFLLTAPLASSLQ